jgi:hypothetical protein
VAGILYPVSITYISIIYKLKKQIVNRFVDGTINDLKINYFTTGMINVKNKGFETK